MTAPTGNLGEPRSRRRAWLSRAAGLGSRISTRLYAAFGVAVFLTLAATFVALFSLTRVSNSQERVNEGSVPELAAAFGVARYTGVLANAGAALTASATPFELYHEGTSVDKAVSLFEAHLEALESGEDSGASMDRLREGSDTLISNIDQIRTEVAQRFELNDERAAQQAEVQDLDSSMNVLLPPAVDDQLFYTLTGHTELGSAPAEREQHFNEEEVLRYRTLLELGSDTAIVAQLLANAFTATDATLLEPLRERFESTVGQLDRNLTTLSDSSEAGREFFEQAAPLIARLKDVGLGENNSFDLAAQEFAIVGRHQELLSQNRDLSLQLVAEADSLVSAAQASAEEATSASEAATATARALLLAISAISIVGAGLIIWLYVGRVLLRRISLLSNWMQSMAKGNLELIVPIGGKDEVADMASSLEVFRRHALEVQRLNLVEELANDLQEKNEEMESLLNQLRTAQDQIVMREKLAALGELTAGVAHEIKNPLNFVKNFSEASAELIDELKELVDEFGERLTDDERSYVNEIANDLTANVERIRSHGDRADRIVRDMLAMGRESGEWQMTNINALLEQHANLAFHSARALDSDFQLETEKDFNPNVGELEVIAQDMGRVFLNMVTNAGHATNERHRAALAAGDQSFAPKLHLATRRTNEHIEIRIRDNGTGMSPEVLDKVFNPFFTTKPTDQGTGLGLSISSDIIRRHGGDIQAESTEGEYTEMIITLPLERPPEAAEIATSGDSWT